MAAEKKEELRLQRGAGTIGVEVGEEGIVGFLEHDGRVEPRTETLRKSGFTRADRTFYRDVPERQCGANDIIAP